MNEQWDSVMSEVFFLVICFLNLIKNAFTFRAVKFSPPHSFLVINSLLSYPRKFSFRFSKRKFMRQKKYFRYIDFGSTQHNRLLEESNLWKRIFGRLHREQKDTIFRKGNDKEKTFRLYQTLIPFIFRMHLGTFSF